MLSIAFQCAQIYLHIFWLSNCALITSLLIPIPLKTDTQSCPQFSGQWKTVLWFGSQESSVCSKRALVSQFYLNLVLWGVFWTILSVTFLQLYLKMGLFNYKLLNENKIPVYSTACNTCSTCNSANLFSAFKRSPRVSLNHLALWNIEKWRDCKGWSFIIHCYISPYEYLIGYLRLKPHNNTSPDLCKTHIFPRFFV